MGNLSIRCFEGTTLRAGVRPCPQRSSASMSCSWLFLAGLVSTRARLRFTNRRTACDTRVLPVEDFLANSKPCLIRLSQARGPLHGGAYLLTDTDSMLFVASERGGPVPCPGGRYQM